MYLVLHSKSQRCGQKQVFWPLPSSAFLCELFFIHELKLWPMIFQMGKYSLLMVKFSSQVCDNMKWDL